MPASLVTGRMTKHELAVLDGELLGDGSLVVGKDHTNARFRLQTAYEGQARFAALNLPTLVPRIYGPYERFNVLAGRVTRMWGLQTGSSEELTRLRSKWYPAGLKIVPPDLILTRVAALHWYIGDGSLHPGNPRITFCTDGFDTVSVARLALLLRQEGFHPRNAISTRGHLRLELGVGEVEAFLLWVGPCPVPEHAHKWAPVFRQKRNRWMEQEERDLLFSLHRSGLGVADIARRLGRSYHTIYSILVWRKDDACLDQG